MRYFVGTMQQPMGPPSPGRVTDEADEALVARVLGGDTTSFEALMRRHNPRLFRAARAILRDDAEAEDVMQETYVSAFQHLGSFAGRAKFSTWLLRIGVHEALGRLRKRKRFASLDDERQDEEDAMSPARTPEDAASDVEVRGLLEAAVDALPIAFRTVFVMRAVEEMSVGEVAEALDIQEETVRTRLHRARALLRADLDEKIHAAAPVAFEFHLSRCDRVVEAVMRRIRPEEK